MIVRENLVIVDGLKNGNKNNQNKSKMIEKLKEWGFYAYKVNMPKGFIGRIIYRRNDFGFGWELDIPYTSVPSQLIGGHSDFKADTTLYKVTGEQRDLIFKFPGKVDDDVLEDFILNSINNPV